MLKYLHIKDFILIDDLEIEFSQGLNILTGETGAGKTIIVGALNAVLGERVTSESIRPGASRGIIRAMFEIKSGRIEEELHKYGLALANQELLLQREILETGKHICRINGQIVTLGVLTEVGRQLVDLHGQHQHQSLLNPATQLELLDRYGNLQVRVEEVANLYKQFTGLISELQKLRINEEEKARQIDLLRFELEEITMAKLKLNEDTELEAEANILRHSEKLYQLAHQSCQILSEAEGGAIIPQLYQVIKKLTSMQAFDSSVAQYLNTAEENYYQLQGLVGDLNSYLNRREFSPERLEEVELRLNLIAKLRYKYGQTIPEILSYADKAAQKIALLIHQEERIEELKGEIEKTIAQLEPTANQLSEDRGAVASILQTEIVKELADLGMKKTLFEISLLTKEDAHSQLKLKHQPVRITSRGFDEVEFQLSPNPGHPLRPLANIASGGELSRVMLAIKTILAKVDEIPTLIFDEIDTGVGGKIGQQVGQKLKHISQSRQVICITHLPQIAVQAETHLYVEKRVINEKTQTTVKPLTEQEQINELALLLDGHEITETSLQHAKELLSRRLL